MLINENPDNNPAVLLSLLQLASPGLPLGAYSYSEGLETLVEVGTIDDETKLKNWLTDSLRLGAVRLEAAVMLRGLRYGAAEDWDALSSWNAWSSAAKETEELRQQSWQMGGALIRLLLAMQPEERRIKEATRVCGNNCNLAIAFGMAAATWQIPADAAILAYLQSWAANLIGAGIKLIPLGQTSGQKLLFSLQPILALTAEEILSLGDRDLAVCSWGLSLASMNHETLYSRLFRS